jgi:hypothetical protein
MGFSPYVSGRPLRFRFVMQIWGLDLTCSPVSLKAREFPVSEGPFEAHRTICMKDVF